MKIRFLILLSLSLTLFLGYRGYSALIFHKRPLDATASWEVEANDGEGASLSATVYQMRGRSHLLFVEIPGKAGDSERWFTIDTRRKEVFSPHLPGRFPYLHYNHDQNLGVILWDPKIAEGWGVRWRDGQIRIASDRLTVQLASAAAPH